MGFYHKKYTLQPQIQSVVRLNIYKTRISSRYCRNRYGRIDLNPFNKMDINTTRIENKVDVAETLENIYNDDRIQFQNDRGKLNFNGSVFKQSNMIFYK